MSSKEKLPSRSLESTLRLVRLSVAHTLHRHVRPSAVRLTHFATWKSFLQSSHLSLTCLALKVFKQTPHLSDIL